MSCPYFHFVLAFTGSFLLFLVFFYLHRRYGERYLGEWAKGWGIYAACYVLDGAAATWGGNLFPTLGQIGALFAGLFLLQGSCLWVRRPFSRGWTVACALGIVWIVVAGLGRFPAFLHTPADLLAGLFSLWTGMLFLQAPSVKGGGRILAGGGLLGWGVHKLSLPFLYGDPGLAPLLYTLGALFTFFIAPGVILLYFEKLHEESRETAAKYKLLSCRFEALFDSIQDPLALLSPSLEIVWANRAAARFFGCNPAEMVGRHCHQLRTGGSEPCEECLAARSFSTGGVEEGEVAGPGERKWNVRVYPITGEAGELTGVIKQMRDVTEEVRHQAETARAAHLASLGELAAGVAHEINNPINGIINYAQLITNRLPEGVREREIAERIIREGNRIAVIVRNLLSFARERRDVKREVTVGEVLNDALALVETQLTRDGIRMRVDMPPDLPPVQGIPHHLQQVFLNLISNARYALNEKYPAYNPEKELSVRAEVVGGEGALRVRTVIEDRGPGIPHRLLGKVMNPFFTTKPADKGTGLGLSISLGIVRDHGGTLAIESAEGEFTRIIIELPAPEGA